MKLGMIPKIKFSFVSYSVSIHLPSTVVVIDFMPLRLSVTMAENFLCENFTVHLFLYVGTVDDSAVPVRSADAPWLAHPDSAGVVQYAGNRRRDIVPEQII